MFTYINESTQTESKCYKQGHIFKVAPLNVTSGIQINLVLLFYTSSQCPEQPLDKADTNLVSEKNVRSHFFNKKNYVKPAMISQLIVVPSAICPRHR